jgi:hypothetical protein
MRQVRHPCEDALVRQPRAGHRRVRASRWPTVAGAAIVTGVVGIALAADFGPPLVGCPIKGNISVNTAERIYHVPGQYYYDMTHIDWLKGERWFCSEDAAKAAGWRRARR